MLNMKKRRIMLDGALIGAELVGSIEIKNSEAYKIRQILKSKGGEERDGKLSILVTYKSVLEISLRTHYHDRSRYYLNISGNPLTFLMGSNTYGYAEADRVMITAYRKALETLGQVPKRIMKAVALRQINIHSLEFATYTNKLKNKEQLLNDWAHMYQSSYSTKDGFIHETLLDMLGLRFTRKHKHHRSIPLRIMSNDGREEEAWLLCYDKAKEMRDEAELQKQVVVVPEDVESRIRLDLTLHQGWFRRHQVGGKKLKTLADLVLYIEKNYGGQWHKFLAFEFDHYVKKTMLFSMWAMPVEKALSGSRVEKTVIKSRSLMRVSDAEFIQALKTKKLTSIDVNPHPELLELDMRIV